MPDETPNGTKIIARLADGSEHDITTAVQVVYDLADGSMDHGSGFLSAEEEAPLAILGRLCGFESFAYSEQSVRKYAEANPHSSEGQRAVALLDEWAALVPDQREKP